MGIEQKIYFLAVKPHFIICLIFLVSIFLYLPSSYGEDENSVENPSPPLRQTDDDSRIWNLENADIRAVINQVADITGKNFIVDPQVQGQITLVSNQSLNQETIYPVFLSMLQVLGYVAIPVDGAIKIIADNHALQSAHPIVNPGQAQSSDQMVVQVIPLKYVPADQLMPILRPLIPNSGHISAFPQGNILIIAGSASHVAHIVEIIERVDVYNANEFEIEVIPVQHGIAADIVQTIQSLLSSHNERSNFGTIYLAADDASNTILLSGNTEKKLNVEVLISQLDSRAQTEPDSETEVVYLKYLNAAEVVPILASVARAHFGAVGTTIVTSSSMSGNQLGSNSGQMNQASGMQARGSNLSGGNNGAGLGQSSPSNQRFRSNNSQNTAFPNQPMNNAAASNNAMTINDGNGTGVEIAAESTTNSVIMTGPHELMRILKPVLARIDIRPAQVLVEALIVEVSETSALDLGVDWETRGFNASFSDSDEASGVMRVGASFGVGFIRAGDIQLILHALREDSDTNILSTPSLVVLDNQEAEISVGQTVPFPTGSFTFSGDSTNPFTTFTREDVALTLAVIPQINQDNSLTLRLFHQNETIDPTSASTTVNGQAVGIPTTNKSEIQTSVIVEDGDVLVLGGLISHQQQHHQRSIPFLSHIPWLGLIFQSHLNNTDRRNLMIFLRPTIIRGPDSGLEITNSKYQYIRNQQIKSEGKFTLSQLPKPWNIDLPLPEPFNPDIS